MSASLTSRQGLFVLATIAGAALILAIVIASASNRRLGANQITLEQVQVPLATDVDLGYSEMNLAAPRVACSAAAAAGTLYADALPDVQVQADATTPLPSEVTAAVSSTVTARLQLTDAGELAYWLNGTQVWTSKQPRAYMNSAATSVLRAAASASGSSPSTWPAVARTLNDVQLHIVPLAITVPRLDAEGRRVLWSMFGGWDATAVCLSPVECAVPSMPSATDVGTIALMSPNRSRRAALLPNGDIAILETAPKEQGSAERVTTLVSSLIQSSCKSA